MNRKRITLAATSDLIKRAESSLIRLGFQSKSNFAESVCLSRSTVTKFFHGQSIQIDSFTRICEALTLNWQDFVTTQLPVEISSNYFYTSVTNHEPATMQTLQRQITVIDRESQTKKAVITLQGDINFVENVELMQAILREHSGDTIAITDIKSQSYTHQ